MHILYGMGGSLYTAKVRAYLRKQGIAFRERSPAHPRFLEAAVPAVGRWIIPVLETPEGAFLQDGADIIAHFEAREPRLPATPVTPVHAAVARLFELFGGEGLLRPAMHYRWNFDAENLAFIKADFLADLAPAAEADAAEFIFAGASGRMHKACAAFGVSPASAPAIEASYLEFLSLFDAHLEAAPYLLGGRPTLGDYGLVGPLHPHLGRDPYPASLMKRAAPRVWRWVARMNAPEQAAAEFGDVDDSLFADDAIPESLKALMRFIAEDYLPEIEAHVRFANDWLAARPELEAGTNGLSRPGDRGIGFAPVRWRGQEITVAIMPYRLYLLQRLQDCMEAAPAPARAAIAGLFAETGLGPLLTLKTRRRVERRAHLEVWGPVQPDA